MLLGLLFAYFNYIILISVCQNIWQYLNVTRPLNVFMHSGLEGKELIEVFRSFSEMKCTI